MKSILEHMNLIVKYEKQIYVVLPLIESGQFRLDPVIMNFPEAPSPECGSPRANLNITVLWGDGKASSSDVSRAAA